jgi:hypothetical protein
MKEATFSLDARDVISDGRSVGWLSSRLAPEPFYLPIGLIPQKAVPGDELRVTVELVEEEEPDE